MTHPEDTATLERDLRAVDSALGGDASLHDDPDVRQLQELALALRADAPVADPAFAERLRRRVETGFPAQGAAARPRGWPRRLAPALGIVTPLVLIVVVVFALGGPPEGGSGSDGGGVGAQGGGGPGGGAAVQEAAPPAGRGEGAAGAGATLAEPPLPGTRFAPRHQDRRIERSIAMTLTAPDEQIPDLADGVNRVTARNGGFVLSSELDIGDGGATASYELRIPVNRLQSALRGLAALGTVSSQSQSGRDVTRDYVTAADRLQAARAERRGLLRRLERADTGAEAEAIRARLDLVAGEINGLRSQLRDLRLRTDYAVVSVDLIGDESDSGASGGGSFDDALHDAANLFVGFAGVLVRVLAIALPLAAIGGLAWAAGAALRRRRRESALA